MEAPKKIYIPTAGDELHYHMTCPNNDFKESIEYTRTEAFMEKAYEWIKKRWSETNDRFKEDYTGMLFEDFKKYIED